MPGFHQIYAKAVHYHLPKYFANFPPNSPIEVGDYGSLNSGVFDRAGNVRDVFGVAFTHEVLRGQPALINFQSGEGISTSIGGTADAVAGLLSKQVSVTVKFAKRDGIVFRAIGCEPYTIMDREAFGREIIGLFERDRISAEFVVVTSLIRAKSLTVVASASAGATIELNAEAELAHLDIASTDIGLRVVHESGLAARFVAARSTIPLVGLSRIRKWPFTKPRFETKFLNRNPPIIAELERQKAQARASGTPLKKALRLAEIDDSSEILSRSDDPISEA